MEIAKALADYLPRLDGCRSSPTGVSTYVVEKPWGRERWLELTEAYALKIIEMKAGHRSSLQRHRRKLETNYVMAGSASVTIELEGGLMLERRVDAGDGWTVPAGRKHRVVAITDYVAVEVSTPHLDDVERLQDDAGRGCGRIDTEHAS